MPKQYWLDELDGLIIEGDVLDSLASLEDESVEAIVTDPPYELGFMGKTWDDQGVSFRPETWAACLRVLKPGGHMVVFGGTRTHHRMWCAIEDAGFEVRDMLLWLYGQGMPKSMDVSKAIDKTAGRVGHNVSAIKREIRKLYEAKGMTLKEFNEACGFEASGYLRESSTWDAVLPSAEKWNIIKNVIGADDKLDSLFQEAEREVVGTKNWSNSANHFRPGEDHSQRVQLDVTAPAMKEAKQWEGWGTGLKPSVEPILLARKPLAEKTVAANVLKHGTGALNIDATRIGTDQISQHGRSDSENRAMSGRNYAEKPGRSWTGRWPANTMFQCTCDDPQPVAETAHQPECPAGLLDAQSGVLKSGMMKAGQKRQRSQGAGGYHGNMPDEATAAGTYGDAGGASRFFYCPKATKKERGEDNTHPTVKPLALMRWLIRLVTPPDGVVLDPFCGSGSTLVAAADEGVGFIGVDVSGEYCAIARTRLEGRTT